MKKMILVQKKPRLKINPFLDFQENLFLDCLEFQYLVRKLECQLYQSNKLPHNQLRFKSPLLQDK
jgi:hypothetical protein